MLPDRKCTLRGRYDGPVDHESVYELLLDRAKQTSETKSSGKTVTSRNDVADALGDADRAGIQGRNSPGCNAARPTVSTRVYGLFIGR